MTINNEQKYRFLIACGGTGGHLFPGIAVAKGLQDLGHQCCVLISEKPVDATAMKKYSELTSAKIPKLVAPPLLSLRIIPFAIQLWKSVRTCMRLIDEQKANGILGMGGFTSLPAVWAARLKGKKIFLHESNIVPGRATKMAAKYADLIFTGFAQCQERLCPPVDPSLLRYVGTPLRPELTAQTDKAQAAQRLSNLHPQNPQHHFAGSNLSCLLVVGGSQGAKGLNHMVAEAICSTPLKDNYKIIHLSGQDDEQHLRELYAKAGVSHVVSAFCHDMQDAYSCADLIIARSGASTLNEMTYFALPSILVPYPHAADDHQQHNAHIFEVAGAARVLNEGQDQSENTRAMSAILEELHQEPHLAKTMAEQCANLAHPNAVRDICQLMIEQLGSEQAESLEASSSAQNFSTSAS